MKAVERRRKERLLAVWRDMLRRLNDMGPHSDDPEHLRGFGEVKDYILDRVDDLDALLTKAGRDRVETRGRKPALLRPEKNSLLPLDNASHNQVVNGVENA
jgi:hypothetical protein